MKQLVLVSAMAAACGSAHAFDNSRQGFLIGVGGGFHSTDINVSRSGNFGGLNGTESGAVLRVMIGAGISEKFAVYGMYDIQQDGDAVYGLLGPGGSYYFKDTGPSFYLFGGTGIGVLSIYDDDDDFNFRDDYDSSTGFGLLFGGGYAFTQGFHLDASLMYLDITDDSNFATDVDYEINSLRVTASYTWF